MSTNYMSVAEAREELDSAMREAAHQRSLRGRTWRQPDVCLSKLSAASPAVEGDLSPRTCQRFSTHCCYCCFPAGAPESTLAAHRCYALGRRVESVVTPAWRSDIAKERIVRAAHARPWQSPTTEMREVFPSPADSPTIVTQHMKPTSPELSSSWLSSRFDGATHEPGLPFTDRRCTLRDAGKGERQWASPGGDRMWAECHLQPWG